MQKLQLMAFPEQEPFPHMLLQQLFNDLYHTHTRNNRLARKMAFKYFMGRIDLDISPQLLVCGLLIDQCIKAILQYHRG